MFPQSKVSVLPRSYPLTQLSATDRTVVKNHSLQNARHAVLTTLCSRACRVVLIRPSFVLRGLFESASLEFVNLSVAGLLAQPGFEFFVAFEQDFQRFRDDVGRRGVNELRIQIELFFH